MNTQFLKEHLEERKGVPMVVLPLSDFLTLDPFRQEAPVMKLAEMRRRGPGRPKGSKNKPKPSRGPAHAFEAVRK